MTNKTKIIISTITFFLVIVGVAVGSELYFKNFSTSQYDFPIKPGSEEWKNFQSHDEMVEASQMLEDVLMNISTKDLVEVCLEYPLFGDFMAYNDRQQGIESVINGFNGLQELINREDAGVELLSKYLNINSEIKNEIDNPGGRISYFEHAYIEMLLAQKSINLKLSEEEDILLTEKILENFRLKQSRPDIYSFSSLQNELLVMKNILIKNQNEKIKANEKIGLESMDLIINQTEQFISNNSSEEN